MTPIGKAPTIQASEDRLLSKNTRVAAIKLAIGPSTTSCGPSQKYAFPMRQPVVTPAISGQPNKAARGIRQSAIRSCTGPNDIGANAMRIAAYRPVKITVKLRSVDFRFSPPYTGVL